MKREFDYYIYLDYSENLIGYIIVSRENKIELLKKTIKFRHFKELRHKRTYLIKIKRIIDKGNLISLIYKQKIVYLRDSLYLFEEIVEFVRKNFDKYIFMSIDNKQYTSFVRLFKELFNQENIFIISEDKLRKNSSEYRLSLVIDNMLNVKRRGLKC